MLSADTLREAGLQRAVERVALAPALCVRAGYPRQGRQDLDELAVDERGDDREHDVYHPRRDRERDRVDAAGPRDVASVCDSLVGVCVREPRPGHDAYARRRLEGKLLQAHEFARHLADGLGRGLKVDQEAGLLVAQQVVTARLEGNCAAAER